MHKPRYKGWHSMSKYWLPSNTFTSFISICLWRDEKVTWVHGGVVKIFASHAFGIRSSRVGKSRCVYNSWNWSDVGMHSEETKWSQSVRTYSEYCSFARRLFLRSWASPVWRKLQREGEVIKKGGSLLSKPRSTCLRCLFREGYFSPVPELPRM